MYHDVTSNGLLGIGHKSHSGARIRLNLVGQVHGDIEFFSHLGQSAQHLVQLLLALRKLSTTRKVGSEQGNDAVNDLFIYIKIKTITSK